MHSCFVAVPVSRFAGDALAASDPQPNDSDAVLSAFVAARNLKTPAFAYTPGKGFTPTEDSQRVVSELNRLSGKQFDLQPANSVQAINGKPMWGSGAGVVFNSTNERQTGLVDPLAGTVHTVAHEGAHAVLPSSLKQHLQRPLDPSKLNLTTINELVSPLSVPRDSGQRLRFVHEQYAKPSLVEETHAQGVADGVLSNLGIPYNSSISDFQDPLDYPKTYANRGIGIYSKNEIGPFSPNENKEADTIIKASPALMHRVFNQGRALTQP